MRSRSALALLIAATSLIFALVPRSVNAGASRSISPLAHRIGSSERSGSPTVVASVFWIQKGLVVQPPKKKGSKAKKGQNLFNRYAVRTGTGQRAALTFPDDTQLQMNVQTSIVLRNPHLTRVNRGTVDQKVEPGTSHQIQTASAVASAIGTEFEVKVSKTKNEAKSKSKKKPKKKLLTVTEVAVKEGVVDVKNARGEVVVHAGEETTVVEGKAPSTPKAVDTRLLFSWTNPIPQPVDKPTGKNIVLQDNGGHIISDSSQSSDTRLVSRRPIRTSATHQTASGFAATNINDGELTTGWSTDHGANTNQWVEFGFSGGNAYQISSIVIDPAATGSHPAVNDAKDFEIWVSPSGLDDSHFVRVLSGTLQKAPSLQLFKLPSPALAQYVKLVVHDNYGGDAIDVAELEIVSRSNPITPPTPVATATPPSSATSTPTAIATPTPTATPVPGSNAVLSASADVSGVLFPPVPLCQPMFIPVADSTFHVSATGLAPSTTYDLAITGSAGGVTVNAPVGVITSDGSSNVASEQFTLPQVPGHKSWTLVATPQTGGPAPSVAFTTTTGWCFDWHADAYGNTIVQWEGTGWKPGGTVTLTFHGSSDYSDQAVVRTDGSVGPQSFQAVCVPGSMPSLSVQGSTIDDPNATDSNSNNGTC